MDIKAEIEKITATLTKDPKTMEAFKKNPVETIKSLVGNIIPEDQLDKVVDTVKAKIATENIADKAKEFFGKFGK